MNFKERMGEVNAFKITDDGISYNSNEDVIVLSSFQRDEKAEKVLRRILLGNKNIILLSPKNVDSNLLCFYIRKFISKNESVEVIRNVKDSIEYVSASKVIVPSPSVRETVKLFELIMYDYKSFIWTMNVKSYSRILKTLETLILLHGPNLTSENAKHLLGESDCCFVFFNADNDGLYYISDIGLAEYDNDDIVILNTLYSKNMVQNKRVNVLKEEIDELPEVGDNDVVPDIPISKNEFLSDELIAGAVQSLKTKKPELGESVEKDKDILIEENTKIGIDVIAAENEVENSISPYEEADLTINPQNEVDNVDLSESESVENESPVSETIESEVIEESENIETEIGQSDSALFENDTAENDNKKINKYKQLKEKLRKRKS